MSNGGFLGASPPEKLPQQPTPELDEYTLAEREAAQEIAVEEKKETFLEAAMEEAPTTTVQTTAQQATSPSAEPAAPMVKDEVTIEVEKIMEDGLGDYVPDMPEEARERFLKKGGEVASQLSVMVRTLNVQVTLVVTLIKEWLTTIPGVNKYFMEQEAKIKTDRILELADQHRRETYGAPPTV